MKTGISLALMWLAIFITSVILLPQISADQLPAGSVILGKYYQSAIINVEENPEFLAVNSKTNTIYVLNLNSTDVSVINGTTNIVIDTIKVRPDPTNIFVNPNTNKVYVCGMGDYRDNSSYVTVFDGATDKEITNIFTGDRWDFVNWFEVNPLNNTIFAKGQHYIYNIDGNSDKIISRNSDPSGSKEHLNPYTNIWYLFGHFSGSLAMINYEKQSTSEYYLIDDKMVLLTPQNMSNSTLKGNSLHIPIDLEINSKTNVFYITGITYTGLQQIGGLDSIPFEKHEKSGTVYAIDGITNKVTGKIPSDTITVAATVDPSANMIYVTSWTYPGAYYYYGINSDLVSNSVLIINGSTNNLVDTVKVGRGPIGIAVNENTHLAYVANSLDGTVSVISPQIREEPTGGQGTIETQQNLNWLFILLIIAILIGIALYLIMRQRSKTSKKLLS